MLFQMTSIPFIKQTELAVFFKKKKNQNQNQAYPHTFFFSSRDWSLTPCGPFSSLSQALPTCNGEYAEMPSLSVGIAGKEN